jgi:hypothetical protein
MNRVLLPLILLTIVAIAISYLCELSYLGAMTLLVGVLFLGGVVTEGEYMPGQVDNPDGKELHPFIILGSLVTLFFLMIAVGYYFPNLYSFGAMGS